MKLLTILFLSALTTFTATAQINITVQQWQDDLRFLQATIHDDYNFLFKKVTAKEFDKAVDDFHKAIPKMEEHEIVVGFARIIAMFKYGHTSLVASGWNPTPPIKFMRIPLNFYQFGDGIFVQGAHNNAKSSVGCKVLKVEGVPIEKAMEIVKPAFPAENHQFFKAYGLSLLAMPEVLHAQGITKSLKKDVTLTLEKNGKVYDQKFTSMYPDHFPGSYGFIKNSDDWVDAREASKDPYYLKHLDKIYYYEYLPEEKTVYVRHSQIQDDPEETIPEFYERVFKFIQENDVEKLVLDVRLNGGGNNYKNKPIVTGIIESAKINVPGKLFVIIGRRTYSACQNLVNELDNYTNAIFVGEPTGENINFYGDNNPVELPNSAMTVRLSFAWWQDKPQWENADWLAPHVAVEMSFEDYKSNKDPVLDVALNFSSDNFILDPMAYLTNLYHSGNSEKLMSESRRMVNDPQYKFFDFEDEFNILGYNLMNRGQSETAVAVFSMVTNLFPESANAWDSLAEGYWKSGEIDKAREFYNKAITMDPDGRTGDNARAMLKRIEAGDKP